MLESSVDVDQEREAFLKSKDIRVTVGRSIKGLTKVLCKPIFTKYEQNVIRRTEASHFMFDIVNRLF